MKLAASLFMARPPCVAFDATRYDGIVTLARLDEIWGDGRPVDLPEPPSRQRWKQPASCLLEREDCTLVACYRSLYAPRAGGAYDSHHRTAGIAGRTRRRGGRVAARGAGAAAGDAGDRISLLWLA